MLEVRPPKGSFGAEVVGVDLARDSDNATLRALLAALYEHRYVVIRDQRLGKVAYLDFGRRCGRPIPHVLDHLRMPDFPEMMVIGNTEKHFENATVRNGAAFWHTDQSYEAEPASATMLDAVKAPGRGGQTLLADCQRAYDALPVAMKQRIEGLHAWHFYGAASGRGREHVASPLMNAEQTGRVPPVRHLIARPHPVTGAKALYAVAGTAYGVDGLSDAEGEALLAELKQHTLSPSFQAEHFYRVGDVAICDTNATLHSGVPIDLPDGPGSERHLWRISVRGRPAVLDQP